MQPNEHKIMTLSIKCGLKNKTELACFLGISLPALSAIINAEQKQLDIIKKLEKRAEEIN